MKSIRLFVCMLTLAALGLGISACDDKEDETQIPVTEASILGKWHLVRESGYDKVINQPAEDEAFDDAVKYGTASLELQADHKFVCVVDDDVVTSGLGNSFGTWVLSGKELTVTVDADGDSYLVAFTVTSLTKKSAIFESVERFEDEEGNAYESYLQMVFKK